jgi:thioredoxin-related protein
MNIVKSAVVVLIFIAAILTVGKIFWEQELKYAKPTPLPEEYNTVPLNKVLDLELNSLQKSENPKHLHFYNPDCPCSKFNKSHYASLVNKYEDKIDFYIIIPSEDQLGSIKEEFGQSVSVIADTDSEIADKCGVYSTPQAVLIDKEGRLYYRGNYNKARYCTSKSTNFAQLAIDLLLENKPAPDFGALSTTAYGCELNAKNWFYTLTN